METLSKSIGNAFLPSSWRVYNKSIDIKAEIQANLCEAQHDIQGCKMNTAEKTPSQL